MNSKFLIYSVLFFSLNTYANTNHQFIDLMKSLTADKQNVVTVVPDINKFYQAENFEQAEGISRLQTYPQILKQDTPVNLISNAEIHNLIQKKKVTFVIVPGLLGEFIDTRAFEEVFARESSFKTEWSKMMLHSSTIDKRFNLEMNRTQDINLAELIDAASLDDANGNALAKLIILKTKIGSLESVGDNVEKATIFNRRLQQYVNLTQDENIVLIGYSRGTPLALEMLSQAEQQNLAYLTRVKALVSYAGVIMGSSLADLTDDVNTDSGKQFIAAKKLLNKLRTSDNAFDLPLRYAQNSAAVTEFLGVLALNSSFDFNSFLKTTMSGDFKTVAMLIGKISVELGFRSLVDFNGHVNRVKKFISEILKSVDGLKTKNTIQWWKTHTLPKNVKYLSISAAMVDPDKSALEKQIYDSKVGYNQTLDDDSLQGNRRTYEKATGFALNDSQVALHQSQFLPKVITKLNSANADLNVESLGLLQTHHWGVSLRVVNVMKDGRVNPFPREKVLLSLAAYLNQ